MKSLELELKERLLFIEDVATGSLDNYYQEYREKNPGKYLKFICKGSEVTEDIAKGYVEEKQVFMTPEVFQYKNYENDFSNCLTALDSFISAIEAKEWYWGENTVKIIERGDASEHERVKNQNEWQKAEEKTFHPEKCLIFKIVEG